MKKLVGICILLMFAVSCSSGSKQRSKSDPNPKKSKSGEIEVEGYGNSDSSNKIEAAPEIKLDEETLESQLDAAVNDKNNGQIRILAAKLLSRDEGNLKALNALGITNYRLGKHGIAEMFWNRVLQRNSNHSEALNNLGVTSLIKKEDSLAIDYFKKAIKADSKNRQALANLGSLYLKYYNFKAAEASFTLARRGFRNDPLFDSNYALSLYGIGEKKKALGMLRGIQQRQKTNVDFSINYASALVYAGEKLKTAEKLLTQVKLLTRDPKDLLRVSRVEKKLKQVVSRKLQEERRSKK